MSFTPFLCRQRMPMLYLPESSAFTNALLDAGSLEGIQPHLTLHTVHCSR